MTAIVVVGPPIGAWRYSEPNQNGSGWWIAFIDDAGCLSVQLDFGDYSYRWNMRGMPERDGKRIGLREFLAEIGGDHYVMHKFARGEREFDPKATLRAVRRRIVELSRNPGARLDRDAAIAELHHANDYLKSVRDPNEWLSGTELDDPTGCLETRLPQQLLSFMENVWPRVVESIRADLARGAA